MTDVVLTTCRKRHCKRPVVPGSIVCTRHDAYRCPALMASSSNHAEQRRCRTLVKRGKRCWRHMEAS